MLCQWERENKNKATKFTVITGMVNGEKKKKKVDSGTVDCVLSEWQPGQTQDKQ